MIIHRYINASDNPAQYAADQLDRQEITWAFREIFQLYDLVLWQWIDGQELDPWRLVDEWPAEPNVRMFMQRDQLAEAGRLCGKKGNGKKPFNILIK